MHIYYFIISVLMYRTTPGNYMKALLNMMATEISGGQAFADHVLERCPNDASFDFKF